MQPLQIFFLSTSEIGNLGSNAANNRRYRKNQGEPQNIRSTMPVRGLKQGQEHLTDRHDHHAINQ